MNFEDWWDTLTPKEQKYLGRNNAEFIWNNAVDSCMRICGQVYNKYKMYSDLNKPISEAAVMAVSDCLVSMRSRKANDKPTSKQNP